MNTTILYWRRTIEVLALLSTLVLVGLLWKSAPPSVVPAILALLGVALGVGQSPMGNPTSTIRTVMPPPPPVVDVLRIPTIPSPPPDMMIPPPHPEEPSHE